MVWIEINLILMLLIKLLAIEILSLIILQQHKSKKLKMKSLIQEKTLIMMKKMIPLAKKKVKMLTFWTTLVIWTSLICLNKIKMQFQNRTQTTVATVTSLTLMLQQHRVNRVKHKLNKNQSKKLIFSLY